MGVGYSAASKKESTKRIEIINHGVMYSDYFQGCGLAFTDFTHVANRHRE